MKNNFKLLEDNYDIIVEEYLKIKNKMFPWIETHLYDGKDSWTVYPIYDWPSASNVEGFTEKVPLTSKLIKECLPNHGAAAFSRLRPNSKIAPHQGRKEGVLRFHLGIDIPDGDCALKCEGKVHHWENGKSFIFDDEKTHEAWNNTDKDRVVLIVDFKREES